jgi:putative transposase
MLLLLWKNIAVIPLIGLSEKPEPALSYKCAHAGVWFKEVDEAFSTQTCSVCNSRTGPQGRKGLGIRGWQCGAIHDRDVNAAQNILAAGHRRIAEEILVL